MSQSNKAHDRKQIRSKITQSYGWALETRYFTSRSWGSKLGAFEAAQKGTDIANPVFLARAAFELAATAHSTNAQDELLVESVERIARLAASPPLEPKQRVEAAIMHANLPLMNLLHIQKTQPELSAVEKAHTQLARAMAGMAGAVATNSIKTKTDFAGASAEAYSLICLQRFQTSQLRTSDWIALPALLSEDNSQHVGSGVRHTWDVSVFTGQDEEDLQFPAYKAQVKSTRRSRYLKEYSPDISLIYLRDDLQLPHEKLVPSLSAIGLAACAHTLDPVDPRILAMSEARIDLLVNALDR